MRAVIRPAGLLATGLVPLLAPGQAEPTLTIAARPALRADLSVSLSSEAGWTGAPDLEESGPGVSFKGWIRADLKHVRVRLDVHDERHINDRTGDMIWDGDFVRIGIDGKGDGTRGGDAGAAGLFGPDDSSIGFALTKSGAEGHTYATKVEALNGRYPGELLKFSRDETTKTTRYEILIPWERIGVRPGAFSQMGMAISVRNIDSPEQREPTGAVWGDGANQMPGLMKRIALTGLPKGTVYATESVAEIWSASDAAEVVVAAAHDAPQTIVATAGRLRKELRTSPGVHYYAVRYQPGTEAAPLKVAVAGASATVAPVVADHAFLRVIGRLDALAATSPHPLFTRHLVSTKAMVREEWSRATLLASANPSRAADTLRYLGMIERGLQGEAAKWEPYAQGRRRLFMAYASPHDKTTQFYTLTLPKGWDPQSDRAYPAYVELHGAGEDHFLGGLGPSLAAPTGPEPYRDGLHIEPFGRGNLGYRGIAEIDVWEAFGDLKRNFKVDEDRQYLFGFSMGGGGTWNLATRTPDRWAAIGILSLSLNLRQNIGLAQNLANVPTYIWGGEEDRIGYRGAKSPKDQIEEQAAEIRKYGGKVQVSTSPGVAHDYQGERQVELAAFLARHRRTRPSEFRFVCDTPEHRGTWGVTMDLDPTLSGAPSFRCRIEGQTVRIDSVGTPGLTVDLGPGGLRMTGSVTVVWNGKTVYEGAVRTVRLIG
ncbi:MAG: hypothetical protein ACO1SV_02370 [Fimbriimonas sp.]